MSVDSIIIHRSEESVTPEAVLRAPMQEVTKTWEGKPLTRPFRWTLVLDPDTLWFGVDFPKVKGGSVHFAHGEFVEWLAQQGDVAELFIMDPSGRYQEFHLTGEGAWWAMNFSGYRERSAQSTKPETAKCYVETVECGWRGVLGIARSWIIGTLDKKASGQVSACLHEGKTVSFVSSVGCPSYEPDFHDMRSFQSIAVSSL